MIMRSEIKKARYLQAPAYQHKTVVRGADQERGGVEIAPKLLYRPLGLG